MSTVNGGFFVTRQTGSATIGGTTTLVTCPADCLFLVFQMLKISNTSGGISVADGSVDELFVSSSGTSPLVNEAAHKLGAGWGQAPVNHDPAIITDIIFQPYIIWPGQVITASTLGVSSWHYFEYRSFFGN